MQVVRDPPAEVPSSRSSGQCEVTLKLPAFVLSAPVSGKLRQIRARICLRSWREAIRCDLGYGPWGINLGALIAMLVRGMWDVARASPPCSGVGRWDLHYLFEVILVGVEAGE